MSAAPVRKPDSDDNVIPLEDAYSVLDFEAKKKAMRPHGEEEGESSWLISYADMMTLLVGFFVMLQSFSKIDSKQFEAMKRETTKVFGGEYKIPFEDLGKKLKEKVQASGAGGAVMFEQTETGVNITFRGALFFDSGGIELKEEAKNLLTSLIPVISDQAKDFGIVVEGHTDNQPIRGGLIASNWELSSIRACTVLRLFEAAGFDKKKLKALGWGDTRPIFPNEDAQGVQIPENQAQNRRVVIKVLKGDTSD